MASVTVTRNPIEWAVQHLAPDLSAAGTPPADSNAIPAIRRIGIADLRAALAAGFADFTACRTDVIFLCVTYALFGLLMGRMALGHDLLPLVFPLVAGFALLGPLLATGLYEMSRRREQGAQVGWVDAFRAFGSPAIGSIVTLGLVLLALFGLWMAVADGIYQATLAASVGPRGPDSLAVFANAVLHTGPGHAMAAIGMAAGFCFAAVSLSISAISFPLMLDKHVGVIDAVLASIRAVRKNPVTMAVWGFVVATLLVLGSLPFLLGLAVVMPILGHATWHLYRRIMPG